MTRELRDMVLIAKHSLLKDPPFSRVDLIFCRNVLIYLDRDVQSQVCVTFHFALQRSGYFFLGSSENADSPTGAFRSIDREARIYQPMSIPPEVRVTPRTNAVKYAALGQKSGRLHVRWREHVENGSPWILVDWKESGVETGQPAGELGRAGNGRRLIENALPYQFGARTSFTIGPDGAHCTIALPLSGAQTEETQDGQLGPS